MRSENMAKNCHKCCQIAQIWTGFNGISWSPRKIMVKDLRQRSGLAWFCACAESCVVFNTGPYTVLPDNSILITANMQSETSFPSSHQLKSYVASKSCLKLAARAVLSADAGLLVCFASPFFVVSLLLFFCLVPCGRLSWLLISFWAHVNIVHRMGDINGSAVLSRCFGMFSTDRNPKPADGVWCPWEP